MLGHSQAEARPPPHQIFYLKAELAGYGAEAKHCLRLFGRLGQKEVTAQKMVLLGDTVDEFWDRIPEIVAQAGDELQEEINKATRPGIVLPTAAAEAEIEKLNNRVQFPDRQ